jgi:subfamily B ATP-binding cassette protein MsbA
MSSPKLPPQPDLYKRLFAMTKEYRGNLLIAMVCMVAVAGLSSLQAFMVKPLLDEIFFNKNQYMLAVLPFAIIGVFLVKGIFYYNYSYLMDFVGESIIKTMRIRLFGHIQSMQITFFYKTSPGEIISRIMNDVSLIQNSVSKALIGTLNNLFQVIGLIGVIFYQDWRLAVVSLIFLPVACYPIVTFGRKYRRLSIKAQKLRAEVSSILHESIVGARIVKAFCMEQRETDRFSSKINDLFTSVMRDVRASSLAHPIMEMLGGIGVAIIVWYGGKKVISGESTPGTFFSFLTALIMIYDPIKEVSKVNNSLQKGLAACSRVFALLDLKPTIVDAPNALTLGDAVDTIEFKDVHFSYDPKNPDVLKGINLVVRTDEVVALVGPSGAGKSTLVNLIPRFFDVTGGAILINGQDIRQLTIQSLRSKMSLVTQDTILFNDTVRNNIAYGRPGCSDDEVQAAAEAAYATEFINKLPDGFNTEIGEAGAKLSGGQRQRISIARALLNNTPLLILDEATSALDTESEQMVQQALINLMQGRTTFVIAHRLSTIKKADRILVFEKGEIVETGNHDTLLEQGGLYCRLHTLQS